VREQTNKKVMPPVASLATLVRRKEALVSIDNSINDNSQSQILVEDFASLFRGRNNCWGSVEGKANKEPVTTEHYQRHLEKKVSLGIYPLLDDNTCWFAAIDIDVRDWQKTLAIREAFRNLNIATYISLSKSKGYHVWIFANQEPFIAAEVRQVISGVLRKLGLQAEIFPKQDKLDQMTPLGNYINLPCFGELSSLPFRFFLSKEAKEVRLEEALKLITRTDRQTILDAITQLPPPPPVITPLPIAGAGVKGKEKSKKSAHPPCVLTILKGVSRGARDVAAFALSRHYLDQLYLPDEVIALLMEWDKKNDPPINDIKSLETKVKSAAKGYAFGCASVKGESLLEYACIGAENCEWLVRAIKERKKKGLISLSARFPGLVDLVEIDSNVRYLILKDDGNVAIMAEITGGAQTLLPPDKQHLPFVLPRANNVIEHITADNDNHLFNDLVLYLQMAAELPTEMHYSLVAWWICQTYLYERFSYSPILAFIGVPERGKSRLGRAIVSLAYRGIETETMREANLFRWSQNLGSTIFLDVRDIWRKATEEKSEDILLKRYERGGKVARVLYPERGPFEDTAYYDIYGPTVIATNEPIQHILESRCLPIVMPLGKRKKWDDLNGELALVLKERLVAFRARHMTQNLPDYPKPPLSRLGDILQPLGVMMRLVAPEGEKTFQEVTRLIWLERLEGKAQSKEARLIKALDEASSNADKVAISDVAKIYNEGSNTNRQLSPESLGRRLRAFGFKPERVAGGARAVIVDHHLLNELKTQWGLEFPAEDTESPKELSQLSQPSFQLGPQIQKVNDGLVTVDREPPPKPSLVNQIQSDGSDGYLPPHQDPWDNFLNEHEDDINQ